MDEGCSGIDGVFLTVWARYDLACVCGEMTFWPLMFRFLRVFCMNGPSSLEDDGLGAVLSDDVDGLRFDNFEEVPRLWVLFCAVLAI